MRRVTYYWVACARAHPHIAHTFNETKLNGESIFRVTQENNAFPGAFKQFQRAHMSLPPLRLTLNRAQVLRSAPKFASGHRVVRSALDTSPALKQPS